MKVEFRNFFRNFLVNIEDSYVDYFFIIGNKYDMDINEETAREIATNFLSVLAKDKYEINTFKNLKFLDLKVEKNSKDIDFLINKSTLYLYEKYIEFMKKEGKTSLELIEKMTRYLRDFYSMFESSINDDLENLDLKIGFESQNHIYSNNILAIFQKIKDNGAKVQFMNLYQGIPISYKGKIVKIDDESVVFEMENELQEVAMKLEGKAYIIKNDHLNRYVKADISYSNFSTKTVVLNNFVYLLNLPAIQREFIRIYPNVFVQVTLESEKHRELSGNLYDLSSGGLGFISTSNDGFCIGARVDIKFKIALFGKEYEVSTKGEILNIIEYMSSFRYCLRIYPDSQNLQVIQKYIKLRELETIEELREELNSYIG